MDTLQVINQNINTAMDTLKVLNDNLLLNINNATNDSFLLLKLFDTIKGVIYIITGAIISTVFTGIRNHNRLFKLYEFINSSFVSLIDRVKIYEKHNIELIKKLEQPENSDFIPPEMIGIEIEIINGLNTEDLFEIFLIRLKTKHFQNAGKDFISMMNSIKYFEAIFDKAKVESKTTVHRIAESVREMKKLFVILLTELNSIKFESVGSDSFTDEIKVLWDNFLKKNEGNELKNYKIFEDDFINPLNTLAIKYLNLNKDIRAFKLATLITSIIQEITNFKLSRSFLKEFLVSNQKNLEFVRVKFIKIIEKFNQANYRNWFFVGLGRIKHDKNFFKGVKETGTHITSPDN